MLSVGFILLFMMFSFISYLVICTYHYCGKLAHAFQLKWIFECTRTMLKLVEDIQIVYSIV
jgi:hypothetical protein